MTYNPVQRAYDLLVDYINGPDEATLDLNDVVGYLGEALDDHADSTYENAGHNPLDSMSVDEIRKGLSEIAAELDSMTEITDSEPTIKDSGDRTKFASGAVRDMRAGKGRFDVMPLEVVGNYICESIDGTDPFVWAIAEFLKSNSTTYLYSAIHHFETMVWNNPYTMLLDVAIHYEEGAKKYGPDNWRKSIPTWCYIDSAVRHYIKWRRGDNDEPHNRAIIWNLLCCIWEVDYRDKKESTNES